jgi:TM2 domain-containing membrane protein YozV
MKCPKCGRETQDKTKFCGWCGADMNNPFQTKEKPIQPEVMDEKDVKRQQSKETNPNPNPMLEPKSKLVAGLLAIFVGGLGIHNFYLGYTQRGLIQLLLSTIGSLVFVGPIISWLWALIEGIQIFTGEINKDAYGSKLKD